MKLLAVVLVTLSVLPVVHLGSSRLLCHTQGSLRLECGGSCYKRCTITGEETEVVRGCASPKRNDTCITTPTISGEIIECYCNTRLCNSSNVATLTLPFLMLFLLVGLMM